MKDYSNKDMAAITGLAGPTIRKYSGLLERAGYTFTRNEQGHRLFSDRDIPVFREVKERSDVGALPLERITEEVAAKYKRYEEDETEEVGNSENPVSTPATTEVQPAISQHIGQIEEAWEMIKVMAEKVNMMDDIARELKEVKEENRMLRASMNQRFDEVLRATMETRKMIAVTEEEKKKSWWKRILK